MASSVPPTLRGIGSYVKIANENAKRDPVIYYWCLLYSVQNAMQMDKKSPEALQFITGLLSTLETVKKQLAGQEAVSNEIVAQAHLENFAIKLFNYADQREKAGDVDKAVVHAFYTAGHLMDVLALFGEIDERIAQTKKYAKWKCMEISKCIREGIPYVPSAPKEDHDSGADDLGLNQFGGPSASSAGPPPYAPQGPQEHGYAPPADAYNQQPPATGYGFNAGFPDQPGHGSTASLPTPVPAPRPSIPAQPHSFVAPPPADSYAAPASASGSGRQPTMTDFAEARKFTKYAMSAIDYEDTKAVIDNLKKALACLEG